MPGKKVIFAGLKVPIELDKRGLVERTEDLVMSDEKEQTKKCLLFALQDCDSDNPFQELGMDLTEIFEINDELAKAAVMDKVKRVFQHFKDRLKFKDVALSRTSRPEEISIEVQYQYIASAKDDKINYVYKRRI